MKDGKLEVGDVIYSDNYGRVDAKYVIDRVTKTKACAGKLEFKIDVGSWGNVLRFSTERFQATSYQLATAELDRRYAAGLLTYQVSKGCLNNLTADQLQRIEAIINEKTDPGENPVNSQ